MLKCAFMKNSNDNSFTTLFLASVFTVHLKIRPGWGSLKTMASKKLSKVIRDRRFRNTKRIVHILFVWSVSASILQILKCRRYSANISNIPWIGKKTKLTFLQKWKRQMFSKSFRQLPIEISLVGRSIFGWVCRIFYSISTKMDCFFQSVYHIS